MIRSGISITANYEEAKGAFSKDDFTYKLTTAFKEARETNLWLRLLNDSKIIKDSQLKEVIKESEEIRNILGKSVKQQSPEARTVSNDFLLLTSYFLLLTSYFLLFILEE